MTEKQPAVRKGSRRMSDIPAAVLRRLNAGEEASITLVEILAIDFAKLAMAADSKMSRELAARIKGAGGIVPRMKEGGKVLLETHGLKGADRFVSHPSDTVRGWAAFVVGSAPGLTLRKRLELIRPFADDAHSGVREWAWIAVRDHVGAELDAALKLLMPWTKEKSANLRRFASEVTRPRGVWCAHIVELKKDPSRGLPILEPLRADASKYVQDSVGNWLNDASKSDGAWVKKVCARWERESTSAVTARICARGLRTLRKVGE